MKSTQSGIITFGALLLLTLIPVGIFAYTPTVGTYQAVAQPDGSVLVMDTRDKSVQHCRIVGSGMSCESQKTAGAK